MSNEKRIIDLTVADLEPIIYGMVKKALGDSNSSAEVINGEKYLDINEASAVVRLSKPSLYRLVGNRKIPFYRSGRKLVFKMKELMDWIEKSRKKFNNLKP